MIGLTGLLRIAFIEALFLHFTCLAKRLDGLQGIHRPATRAFELHLQRLPSGQQFVAMRAANVIKNLLHYVLRVVPQGVNP